MTRPPAVSVVMPVYNGEKYVARAIESILHQTFRDFELLIIDDGSTDATAGILADYAARDARIRVLAQPQNTGVALAATCGCREARGTYLARMDADDVSTTDRFERQVTFLETHPDIGVLGANIQEFDDLGPLGGGWRRPTEPHVIRWFLLFGDPIANSTTMMRRNVFERFGPYRSCAGEDYDFWARASSETKMANLPSVLLQCCVRADSLSRLVSARSTDFELQRSMMADLIQRDVSFRSIELLRLEGIAPADPQELDAAAGLLADLYEAYLKRFRPKRDDRAEIAFDVFKRLQSLAVVSRNVSARRALQTKLRSLRYLTGTLSIRLIKMAARRGARVLWKRTLEGR